MTDQSFGPVSFATDGAVATITLDRPEVRNAMDTPSWEGLIAAIDEIERRPDLRAAVLTGAGGAFSAGGDLSSMGADPRPGIYGRSHRLLLAEETVRRIYGCPLPIVAAIPGPTAGVGWSIALACDLLVASREAYFLAPFLDRGLVPDGGCLWLLAQSIGRHRATALAFTRSRIPAERAQEFGFVHEIVDPGDEVDRAREIAADFGRGPTETIGLVKSLLRRVPTTSLVDYLDLERDVAVLNRTSGNPEEGVAAWRERREPKFS